MLSHALTTLLAVSLVAAAPTAVAPADFEIGELAPGHFLLTEGELAGQIVNTSTWGSMLRAENILPERPEVDYAFLNFTASAEDESTLNERDLESRQCGQSIVTDKTERFVDWDVQMSPIVCGRGGDMDVTVTSGFMVANGFTLTGTGNPTIILQKLTASFGVSFTKTWTTQYSVATKSTVPKGQCGVIVTNPLTTRRYGRVMQGCPGKFREVGHWMADDRGSGSYAGVEWVSGAISTCYKRQTWPPMTRCHGKGEFR